MTIGERNYDQGCLDLAESFLSDHPNIDTDERAHALAGFIQDTIEDFLRDAEKPTRRLPDGDEPYGLRAL